MPNVAHGSQAAVGTPGTAGSTTGAGRRGAPRLAERHERYRVCPFRTLNVFFHSANRKRFASNRSGTMITSSSVDIAAATRA